MAKNQNLALNPSKVSGGCGRLLCCLTYENDLYTELRRLLPPRGTRVRALEDGVVGDVIKGDILNQVVVIETADGRQLTVPVAQLEMVKPGEAADEDEADSWGEDLDFKALAALSDEATPPSPAGRGREGSGGAANAPSQNHSDRGGAKKPRRPN
jgi:hypothetical protein